MLAEPLPKEKAFALSLGFFQILCLIGFAVHFDTQNASNQGSLDDSFRLRPIYGMYMDVHVMIFVGFGFLMTYLRKYSLSAVSLNFVIAAIAVQWGIIMVTMVHQIGDNHYPTAIIDVRALVNGDFAAGAVLISFGAVLGKVTPTQLIWMTFIEVIFYAINEYILYSRLEVLDAGGSMVIHTFGAFFGLALSLMMGIPSKQDQKHNTSRYTSDIFSMIGTLFLWMYWPSFNGALVPSDGFRQERAVTNTLLSIAASCVTAFVFTVLLSASKKFELVHLQNATLAGGVAMGATCELAINPASAITIGIVAGAISVGGYTNFLGYFEHTIKLSDTAGILNLHGMPGVLGGLAAGFATLAVPNEKYGSKVAILSMYPSHMTRSIGTQAGYQFLGILITLGISIISGVLTGIFLRSKRFFRQQEQKYQDEEWFHVPEGFCMANVRVITSHTDSQDLEEHPQYLSIQSPRDACINAVALDIASTN